MANRQFFCVAIESIALRRRYSTPFLTGSQNLKKAGRLFTMKRLITTICLTTAVLLGSVGVSTGADFQKGLTAAQSGDFATVLREWTPLAEQGNAGAQFNLGYLYRMGEGVPQDYKNALKWWKLAAGQGDASAQGGLGYMSANGKGVPIDFNIALKWWTLAAEQGDVAVQSGFALQPRNFCTPGYCLCPYVGKYRHAWWAQTGCQVKGMILLDK